MGENNDTEFGSARGQLDLESAALRHEAPPAPPPMPISVLVAAAQTARPRPASSGGWAVDPYSLREFAAAIDSVREWLRVVDDKIELMRSASYTPSLGTSPVAEQLEHKFRDRLDAPLDDPKHPTSGGLRPMLAEARRRMEEFLAGAEDALRLYRDFDTDAADRFRRG
ncbi:hypothetical protein [Actinophytocola sp.]|uniref:hypothetical protein n=1 Tax=Actinophytocola sp. TaxID=1872138 RepID=UPI002D7FFFFD|nr:hypothetical protein [Actinophytocola sp.]HET9140678.1 hypothetical protein [Actinophytocola sp.]